MKNEKRGYVLWGFHPDYAPVPIKISGGLLRHVYSEARWRWTLGGWKGLVIRPAGAAYR
jgi:hypothetical protein